MQYLLSICLVLFGSIVIDSKVLIQREINKIDLDCSKFRRDLDVLRSFSYPVQINPFTIVNKTYAILNPLNQVEELYIVRESSVPIDVFCLVHLHTFKVYSTRFDPPVELDDNSVSTDLPSQISRLIRLRILLLVNSSISHLPPDAIASLTSLTSLEINDCGLLELPSTISSLRDLKILQLPHNRLTSLPESLGSLSKLQTLNIMNNSISTLPSTTGSMRNLTTVIVSWNPIISLQPLSELPKLTSLTAVNCRLKILPINLPILSIFLASYNNIDDISDLSDLASTKLTRLDLSYNEIDYVPPQITRFASSLTSVNFKNNKLLHLPTESKNDPPLSCYILKPIIA